MDDTKTANTDIDDSLYEAYTSAPKPAKDYIDSGKFEAFVEFLKNRLTLTSEDTLKASNEILLALLGITDPTTLESNLEHGQLLSATVAAAIASEAKRTIFDDLQARAKELEQNAGVVATPPAPVPPPPINRLAPIVVPPIVASTPVPVIAAPSAPVVPTAPVKIPPIAAPTPAPIIPVPSASPLMKMPTPPIASAPAPLPPLPPLPPIIAPTPTTVIEKKRPAEHGSQVPVHPPATLKADPYREPVE